MIVFFFFRGCPGTPRALPLGEGAKLGVILPVGEEGERFALAEGFLALGRGMFITREDCEGGATTLIRLGVSLVTL